MTMFFLFFNARTIFRDIYSSSTYAAAPVFVIIYGFFLRVFYSTHSHMIFFDEYNRFKIVKLWLAGIFNYPLINDFPGPMMAYLLFYKLFGATPDTGYGISIGYYVASSIILYALVNRMWHSPSVTFFSLLLLAVYPINLLFAATHAAELPNMFFSLLAFYACLIYIDKKDLPSLIFMASSFSFLLFMRIYNILFVLYLICLSFSLSNKRSDSGENNPNRNALNSYSILSPQIIFALMALIPFLAYLTLSYYSITEGSYSSHVTNISMPDHIKYFFVNILYFFDNRGNPVPLTFVVLFGICVWHKSSFYSSDKRNVLMLAGWFFVCFLSHLSSVYNYCLVHQGNTSRYTIDFHIPLLILTAVSIHNILIYSGKYHRSVKALLFTMFVIYIATLPVQYSHIVKFVTRNSDIVRIVTSTAEKYSSDTLLFTNAVLVSEAIVNDLNKQITLTNQRDTVQSLCEERKCVFILMQSNEAINNSGIRGYCRGYFRSEFSTLLICSTEEAEMLPSNYFDFPDHF
jgi:hypothetical protein